MLFQFDSVFLGNKLFKPYGPLFLHEHPRRYKSGDLGGGGTPLYRLYRFVRPQRVWFFILFGHKLGIDFRHFAAILVTNRVLISAP